MNTLDKQHTEIIEDRLWDHYSGLPNPMWYQSEVETKDNLGCLYPDCICQGNEITNCQNRI